MSKKPAFTFTNDNGTFRTHFLKTTQPYFGRIDSGEKTLEIRRFDRDFRVGDYLTLNEYGSDDGAPSCSRIVRVTDIMTNADHEGIAKGFVAMSITLIDNEEFNRISLLA
jgi:hypothetical protein